MKTHYQCQACGAEDSDSGANPPAPIALVCWRCRNGRGLNPAEMVAEGRGMLPVTPPPE